MNRFFCSTNLHLFCPYYRRWGKYLIDRGCHADFNWLMDKLAPYQERVTWAENVVEQLNTYKSGVGGRQYCRLRWLVQRVKEYGKAMRRYLYNPLPPEFGASPYIKAKKA